MWVRPALRDYVSELPERSLDDMVHPRFDFYEEVRILTRDPLKLTLNGELGVVLGRTETDDHQSWYYAIDVASQAKVWCFFETELEPTGRKFKREDYYE